MEHSCSSLHLLADVACDLRQIELRLARILGRKLSSTTKFTEKREENLIGNADSEEISSERNLKRKPLFDAEAENQETKKRRYTMTQSVPISKPNLGTPCKTRISSSVLKFHNVSQSFMNPSSTASVSKHGILMNFLKNQLSWQGKRRRSAPPEAVLKGCEISSESNHRREGTIPPSESIGNGYQPELPMQFENKIQELGGLEAELVIQKQLHASDVNSSNCRFSIPEKQIQNEFLKENEKHLLDTRIKDGQNLCRLDVLVLSPSLRKFSLKLKKWKMQRNTIYNLTHEWNNIRISNGLVENDMVQLRFFRRRDQLCFALIKL